MGLLCIWIFKSKFQLLEPQFCYIPSVLRNSCCSSFRQNNTWTLGIDLTIRDGDCIKPLLNPDRIVDNVAPPKVWYNRRALSLTQVVESYIAALWKNLFFLNYRFQLTFLLM